MGGEGRASNPTGALGEAKGEARRGLSLSVAPCHGLNTTPGSTLRSHRGVKGSAVRGSGCAGCHGRS